MTMLSNSAATRIIAALEEPVRLMQLPRDPGKSRLREFYRALSSPIDMVLHCSVCHLQHIDEADYDNYRGGWDNPPHRTHLCAGCGNLWRPANVPTNGVAELP